MYDIAICDDDRDFVGVFQSQLTRALDARAVDHRVTVFSAPEELRRAVAEGHRYGLLFLDVLFAEEEQGISLARWLRENGCETDVVFMSSSANFAVDSFDVAPLHYLLKPVSDEKLNAALTRFLDKNTPYLLRFDTARRYFQLPWRRWPFSRYSSGRSSSTRRTAQKRPVWAR